MIHPSAESSHQRFTRERARVANETGRLPKCASSRTGFQGALPGVGCCFSLESREFVCFARDLFRGRRQDGGTRAGKERVFSFLGAPLPALFALEDTTGDRNAGEGVFYLEEHPG